MVILYLTYQRTANLFFKVASPLCLPTSSVGGSPHPCQHLLVSVILTITILVGGKWYLTVSLTSISLMTNDVVHLFICLPAICISLAINFNMMYLRLR
uniref:Uncharacterized protein n=1 Tax=Rhinopithecus roxellana TaxID=61622 RepID=A0A2K6QBT0_RHIRO